MFIKNVDTEKAPDRVELENMCRPYLGGIRFMKKNIIIYTLLNYLC